MTPLMAKAIIIMGMISIALLFGYGIILEEGMFGNEEEHIITVEWKKHEFYWDSGCWNYFFAGEKGNVYNIPRNYIQRSSQDIPITSKRENDLFSTGDGKSIRSKSVLMVAHKLT